MKGFQLAHDKRSPRTARPPRKLPESQSKFDRWLEQQVEAVRKVEFKFQVQPVPAHLMDSAGFYSCQVIAVDRYMLLLEFYDGQTWWVQKSNILTVGTAE